MTRSKALEDGYVHAEAVVRERVALWTKRLGIHGTPGGHDIDVRHVYVHGVRSDDEDTAADTDAKWEYRQARITWYLGAFGPGAIDDLAYVDSVVVHELVHVLVASMEHNVAEKHTALCEYAVESVTRSILHLTGWMEA